MHIHTYTRCTLYILEIDTRTAMPEAVPTSKCITKNLSRGTRKIAYNCFPTRPSDCDDEFGKLRQLLSGTGPTIRKTSLFRILSVYRVTSPFFEHFFPLPAVALGKCSSKCLNTWGDTYGCEISKKNVDYKAVPQKYILAEWKRGFNDVVKGGAITAQVMWTRTHYINKWSLPRRSWRSISAGCVKRRHGDFLIGAIDNFKTYKCASFNPHFWRRFMKHLSLLEPGVHEKNIGCVLGHQTEGQITFLQMRVTLLVNHGPQMAC